MTPFSDTISFRRGRKIVLAIEVVPPSLHFEFVPTSPFLSNMILYHSCHVTHVHHSQPCKKHSLKFTIRYEKDLPESLIFFNISGLTYK